MKQKLTSKFIETRKPDPKKRIDFRDTIVPGLVLRVSTSGTKTFSFHKRVDGKMRRLTIGRFGTFTLTQARDRARQILYEIETGRFEANTGIEIEAKPKLGEVIPDYMEKHAKAHNRDWKNKARLLGKFTGLHGKRIDEIKRVDVVKACDTIHKSTPVSANRALAHLKHLMGWCVERGMIDASPIAGMKPLSKERPRERVLTDDELGALWAACDAEGYPFGDCMKLLILSGQRRAEVPRFGLRVHDHWEDASFGVRAIERTPRQGAARRHRAMDNSRPPPHDVHQHGDAWCPSARHRGATQPQDRCGLRRCCHLQCLFIRGREARSAAQVEPVFGINAFQEGGSVLSGNDHDDAASQVRTRLIDILLLRIIAAHEPSKPGETNGERLKQAKAALFGANPGLGVEPQQVVPFQSYSADRRL